MSQLIKIYIYQWSSRYGRNIYFDPFWLDHTIVVRSRFWRLYRVSQYPHFSIAEDCDAVDGYTGPQEMLLERLSVIVGVELELQNDDNGAVDSRWYNARQEIAEAIEAQKNNVIEVYGEKNEL